MVDTITGKVAAIIDDTTLVLNVGSGDGVSEGMIFAIFVEYQDILDPDSGESLGKWEMVKARVSVEYVQERLCTVRSSLTADADRPGTLSAAMVQHSFGNYGSGSEQRERLHVRSADASGRPQSQPIAVGDGARLLAADDDGGATGEETVESGTESSAEPATDTAEPAEVSDQNAAPE